MFTVRLRRSRLYTEDDRIDLHVIMLDMPANEPPTCGT
jgi:hypothetical protein